MFQSEQRSFSSSGRSSAFSQARVIKLVSFSNVISIACKTENYEREPKNNQHQGRSPKKIALSMTELHNKNSRTYKFQVHYRNRVPNARLPLRNIVKDNFQMQYRKTRTSKFQNQHRNRVPRLPIAITKKAT